MDRARVGSLVHCLLYLVNCKILREGLGFVGTTVLPQTPTYIIGFAGVIGASHAVYMGVEVVMRGGEFITSLAFIVAPVLLALSMQHMDVHQLMPVLADGWKPVLRGAVTPDLTYVLELLIGLQFAHVLRNSRAFPKDMLIATTVVIIVFQTFRMVITIGVVGQSASCLLYPVLKVVRSIRVGTTLERLDTLYVMGMMSTILIKLSLLHYACCKGMKDVFKLSSHRIVRLPETCSCGSAALYAFATRETWCI